MVSSLHLWLDCSLFLQPAYTHPPSTYSVSSCLPNLPTIHEMAMLYDISRNGYLGRPVHSPSGSVNCSPMKKILVCGRNKGKPHTALKLRNLLETGHLLPLVIETGTPKHGGYKEPVPGPSFPFSLSKGFSFNFPSLLDEDGYINFPHLPEICISFLPPGLQHYIRVTSPSFIPSFLVIFLLLLSTLRSIPFSLILSLPVTLSLCYLEPKATALNASNDTKDKAEEQEVCNFVA